MKPLFSLLLSSLLLVGCSFSGKGETLFPPSVYQASQVALEEKLSSLSLSSPLDTLRSLKLSEEEREALYFLYAYMITPDMVDYPLSHHLADVRVALRAREELPWGKEVPPALWRHFVLPTRVNNEALDQARPTLYEELKEVVKDMDIKEAVLALNHWCHRHVTYAPSDGRTSSPLATMRNALGRCGEESTFTVAVLRTMGIPARQVYTPRWAHTDSNHAWVEAWVGDGWHYLGACEPSPVLDNAWFDAPVKRAMLLHTKVFGDYNGSEEILSKHPTYTEINVTSNYVPTSVAKVYVVDSLGKPQKGVPVTFRLYNFAELFVLGSRLTGEDGGASMELGLGDIVVFAGDSPHRVAMSPYTVSPDSEPLTLTLSSFDKLPLEQHYRLVPPPERKLTPQIDSLALSSCALSMERNDQVRSSYTSTFPTDTDVEALAKVLQIPSSSSLYALLGSIYKESRGNSEVIREFLTHLSPSRVREGLLVLNSLSRKDLHDVTLEVLEESVSRSLSGDEWSQRALVSPRVAFEKLWPVSDSLEEALGEIRSSHPSWSSLSEDDRVALIAQRIEEFRVDTRYNPISQPISPASVWRMKGGDAESLGILLVRLLRLEGIPAVWDESVNKPVYWSLSDPTRKLVPYRLDQEGDDTIASGCPLRLEYTPSGYLKTPKYMVNFSIGYVLEDGSFQTYGYPFGASAQSLSRLSLLHPRNILTTGTRMADGSVLLSLRRLECGGGVTPLLFDQDTTQVSVIGSMDPEASYYDLLTEGEKSIMSTTGRGYFVLVLGRAHHEPTDHILRDVHSLLTPQGELPLPLIVMTQGGTPSPTEAMKGLLPQATWGEDRGGKIEKMLTKGCELEGPLASPIVAICDTFGRIVYLSQGYTIGIGERIAATVGSL